MTKSKLVKAVSERVPNITKKDIKVIVDVVFESMVDALKRDEKVEVRGFGSFKVKNRDARYGRNPKTGVVVSIPQRKTPFFKGAKEMKERVDLKRAD